MTNPKRIKEFLGDGIELNMDPELRRSFDFEGNVVPANLRKPENVKIQAGKFRVSGDGVFYTIQGEGPTMGEPTVFLRLHVCNLRCAWCFPAGTMIKTPQGGVPIENIKEGQEVVSYKDGKYTVGLVQKILERKKEYIEIETESGVVTQVTSDHVYHVDHRLNKGKRGMSREYPNRSRRCQAKYLEGKYVLKAVGTPFEYPLTLDTPGKRLGYLKGAMLGDGNVTKQGKYYRIYWQVTDIEFAEQILDIMNMDLGHSCTITKSSRKTATGKTVYRVSASREDSAKLLLEEPKGKDEVIGFVSGFFDAEGHTGRNQLILSQKDQKVLHRIQGLLEDLDFESTYESREKADALVINGKENLERFFKTFPVQITRKIDKFINTNKTNVTEKVTKVSDVKGTTIVYNLQTTFGNIFANGYLVDQCDAYYTWNPETTEFWTESKQWTVKETADKIREAWGAENPNIQKRVVLTGGEPLLHKNQIDSLIDDLGSEWMIEIETNGTIMPTEKLLQLAKKEPSNVFEADYWKPQVQFNCSPKLNNSKNLRQARIKPEVIKELGKVNTVFKFVVMHDSDIDEIEKDWIKEIGINPEQIILMPQGVSTEEIQKNMQKVVEYTKKKGYRMLGRLQVDIWGAKRRV